MMRIITSATGSLIPCFVIIPDMTFLPPDVLNKRILITGAGGFIGRRLAMRLVAMGAEVHGTSRNERNGDPLAITWWKGSFEDMEVARTIFENVRPDVVFHLSGLVSGATAMENVLPAFSSHVASTLNLLTLAAKIDCDRVLIIGSSTEPINAEPSSPYAAAKWASTMYGQFFHKLYDLPIVVARPFVGYGPGQAADKLVPYVISRLINGQRPRLSSGLWKTDWTYIDDMVEGILRCGYVHGIEGCTIDIGTGQLTSVHEVVQKIVTLLDSSVSPIFGAVPDRYSEHTLMANTEHTWEKIHWKSTVSLDEGLKRTIASVSTSNGVLK